MDTCPICNCLLTDDNCVMCGYKSKANNIKNNNKSVFDIFDFIDNKPSENIYKDNKISINRHNTKNIKSDSKYEKNEYEKNEYKQVKYDKNTNDKNNNIGTPKEINIEPVPILGAENSTKNKSNKFFIFSTLFYILLFFITPNVTIIVLILKGVIKNVSQKKYKK